MNIIIIATLAAITIAIVVWLTHKFCIHSYEIIDKKDHDGYRMYVMRCVKCGKLKSKKVRL